MIFSFSNKDFFRCFALDSSGGAAPPVGSSPAEDQGEGSSSIAGPETGAVSP